MHPLETGASAPASGPDQPPARMAAIRQNSLFTTFDRPAWSSLGKDRVDLSAEEVMALQSTNEHVDPLDLDEIFGPLCRLIRLHVEAARSLTDRIAGSLLKQASLPRPYVIGIAGSVAVGKSTFARLLRRVLARHSNAWKVELVATDGFLLPTRALQAAGLMGRKGFPESYDLRRMVRFLSALKEGAPSLEIPVYSHERYDIVEGRFQEIAQPDILIFEGLNVLQTASDAKLTASDFFDFSVYIDAATDDIERWYVDRFLLLQRTVFQRPASYFHHFKDLTEAEARAAAAEIWRTINLPNLENNILPTRERARAILHKSRSHRVESISLRQGW